MAMTKFDLNTCTIINTHTMKKETIENKRYVRKMRMVIEILIGKCLNALIIAKLFECVCM